MSNKTTDKTIMELTQRTEIIHEAILTHEEEEYIWDHYRNRLPLKVGDFTITKYFAPGDGTPDLLQIEGEDFWRKVKYA